MKNFGLFILLISTFNSCKSIKDLVGHVGGFENSVALIAEDVTPLDSLTRRLIYSSLSEITTEESREKIDSLVGNLVMSLNSKIDSIDLSPIGKKLLAGIVDTLNTAGFQDPLNEALDSIFSNIELDLKNVMDGFFSELPSGKKASQINMLINQTLAQKINFDKLGDSFREAFFGAKTKEAIESTIPSQADEVVNSFSDITRGVDTFNVRMGTFNERIEDLSDQVEGLRSSWKRDWIFLIVTGALIALAVYFFKRNMDKKELEFKQRIEEESVRELNDVMMASIEELEEKGEELKKLIHKNALNKGVQHKLSKRLDELRTNKNESWNKDKEV